MSIYLDHNATTPLDPAVAEAMLDAWRAAPANPASQHQAGRKARRILEEARESIAAILGARTSGMDADQVVFTSGGTEANNLALLGMGREDRQAPAKDERTVLSSIEHPSVAGAAEALRRQGCRVEAIRCRTTGVVDLEHLRELLQAGPTRLVSLMLANNETGVIQPVEEAAPLARQAGALLHTDAVQMAGKLPVDFRQLGVDAMTIAAHKFHGPAGIGALVVRSGVKVAPILHGGFQQMALRPGTEPVPLAVGMAKALQLWQAESDARAARLRRLRDRMERLLQEGWPELVVNGGDALRTPHTSNVAFPGVDRQAAMMALDLAGVACSTGSACASGSSEPSPVLIAMGCPEEIVASSLRLSLGAFTGEADIDEAARRILLSINDLRRKKDGKKSSGSPRQGHGHSL